MPFGSARTSPISASDVARVVSTILEDPTGHLGKVYELTGPRSEDMNEIAKEYAIVRNRPVKYVDTPYDKWLAEGRIIATQFTSVRFSPRFHYNYAHRGKSLRSVDVGREVNRKTKYERSRVCNCTSGGIFCCRSPRVIQVHHRYRWSFYTLCASMVKKYKRLFRHSSTQVSSRFRSIFSMGALIVAVNQTRECYLVHMYVSLHMFILQNYVNSSFTSFSRITTKEIIE